jgi:2'-5' RNA ligase
MPRTRTFLAVELDPAVVQAATALQAVLAKSAAGVRWASPTTFHVTLQFLGEVDDRELHTVCRTAEVVCRRLPPFPLSLRGVGAFPNLRRPKTVWAGVSDGAVELQRLFAALEDELLSVGGYRRENRPYTPHLTLGRVTTDDDSVGLASALSKFEAWAGGTTAVGEVVVFTSQLRRDGPEYTAVGRAALRGKPEAPLRPPAEPAE